MIGPVSTTGQTMMQSLQNAMSKGMPVDQAIAYVKSMAMDGVAPLTDLYSMMLQFQRLKQPTRRPPEGGSIRDQLQMLQGQDPMQQGLGGMDAGAMENPSFAGGGIVAFDEGGAAQSAPASITPQLYSPVPPQFKTWDEAAAAYRNILGADPNAMIAQEMERRRKLAEEQGLDEYGRSFELRESMLGEDKERAEKIGAEEAQFDEDEYWGDVAENATESGATLLTSLAKAQKGKAKRKRATAEKVRTAMREAKNSELLLEQAREAEREGRRADAIKLRDQAYANAENAQGKIADAQVEADKSAYSRETQLLVARAQKGERERVLGELSNKLSRLDPDSPEFAKTQKQFNAVNSTTAAAQIRAGSASLSVMRDLLRDTSNSIRDYRKSLTEPIMQFDKTKAANIQREIERLEERRLAILEDYPELRQAISGEGVSFGGAQGAGNPASPAGLEQFFR